MRIDYQIVILKTDDFDALPLNLTLRLAFDPIMKNVTDVITTREEMLKTNKELLTLTCDAGNDDGIQNYLLEVTKITRRLAVLNNGKAYDSELLVAQCQSAIRDSGISKRELRKIDKEWTKEDTGKDEATRFERFKTYYIAETAILAADEVQGTNNRANSAVAQQLTELEATVTKLKHDNSVLMTNQEDMASHLRSGVPNEISVGGGGASVAPSRGGGASVTPAELSVLISQALDQREGRDGSNSSRNTGGNNGGNTTRDTITWWRQFKYYCGTCGVNLTHGGKKCKSRNKKKEHDETATWDKKESPRTNPKVERRDRLWMQWCEPITLKVHKEKGKGESR